MAKSPAHQLGLFIGDFLENSWKPILERIASTHGCYLDYKHDRPARSGRNVTWQANRGNEHDLDFVIEEDGSDFTIGKPRAFVETGYRRYTKHSRSKVKEIAGMVVPVAELHSPGAFLGVVLAGEFTENAINEIRSWGFSVLHYSFQNIVDAFLTVGIDIYFNKDTPTYKLKDSVRKCHLMDEACYEKVLRAFRRTNAVARTVFISEMRSALPSGMLVM